MITHLQPTVTEEAVKEDFFDPPRVEKAFRLARNMGAYNAMISYLLSLMSSGTTHEPGSGELLLRATEEIEETRRAASTGPRRLSDPGPARRRDCPSHGDATPQGSGERGNGWLRW